MQAKAWASYQLVGIAKDSITKGTKDGSVEIDMSSVVDSTGNKRFIEGNIVLAETLPDGLQVSYSKWSLSGTHLMIVFAGTIDAEKAIPQTYGIANVVLPPYINDKIFPLVGPFLGSFNGMIADVVTYNVISIPINVDKVPNGLRLDWRTLTAGTNNRSFRFQIDLLIDSE